MKQFNQFFTDQIRTLNEGLYDRLSHYMTEPLKVGRNVIRGYPVDVDDTPTPDTGLTMTAVDRDAAKGLAAELRSAGFKVTVTRGVDLLVTEGVKLNEAALGSEGWKVVAGRGAYSLLNPEGETVAKLTGSDVPARAEQIYKILTGKATSRPDWSLSMRDTTNFAVITDNSSNEIVATMSGPGYRERAEKIRKGLHENAPPGWDDNIGWRGPSKSWFPHGKKPEEKEPVKEELPADATASDWIEDFVHSKNPKFEGKSEKERTRMALAAYYASRQKNEGWKRFMLEDVGDVAITQMNGTWVIYDPDWELVYDHNNENWVPRDNMVSSGYPGFPTREEASKYLDNAKRTMRSDEL